MSEARPTGAADTPAAHDPATERAFCDEFGPALRLYGRRHLADAAAAEDLAQETLAVVLTALREGRVDGSRELGRYVFGVARNKVRELRRAERRRGRIEHAVLGTTPGAAEHEPILVGFRMHLFGCLSQLTERTRQVLERTYFAEEAPEEIAAALAVSIGNVRVIRHRALGALRRCLEGGEP